jgi:hypothetical protein
MSSSCGPSNTGGGFAGYPNRGWTTVNRGSGDSSQNEDEEKAELDGGTGGSTNVTAMIEPSASDDSQQPNPLPQFGPIIPTSRPENPQNPLANSEQMGESCRAHSNAQAVSSFCSADSNLSQGGPGTSTEASSTQHPNSHNLGPMTSPVHLPRRRTKGWRGRVLEHN